MYDRRNKWEGEGNLARDPEIHQTPNGAEVVHFTLAISGAGTAPDEKDAAGFMDCKMWLTQNDYTVPADIKAAIDGFKGGKWVKGTKLYVNGRLMQERWKTKNDEPRSRVIILANRVQAAFVRQNDREEGTVGELPVTTTTTATTPPRSGPPDSF